MFKVTQSSHGMKCIQMEHPTEAQRKKIRSIVLNNWTADIECKLSQNAGAFIQCDNPEYILVEFWGKDYIPFVNFVNEQPEFSLEVEK